MRTLFFASRFLGYVDLRGTTYQASTIATGFGAHLAQPLLRKRVEGREDDITEQEAIEIINDCMRVLFYRDARSINKVGRLDSEKKKNFLLTDSFPASAV